MQQRIKIIIGDKSKTDRDFLKDFLKENAQCEISEIIDTRELLTKAVNHPPDLLILDLNIEQNNGEKLIEIIRSIHSKEALPIIAIGDWISRERILNLMRLGITDLLLKPIFNAGSEEKLRKALQSVNTSMINKMEVEEEQPGGRPRFLLADPDKSFKDMFQRACSSRFEIFTADNGEEGLALFMKKKPDYVLIAERLKIYNERVLAQKIRETENGSNTKIFFLSTILKSSSMKSTLFNGVIEKGVSTEAFFKDFEKIVIAGGNSPSKQVFVLLRQQLQPRFGPMLKKCFQAVCSQEIEVHPKGEVSKIANEALATVELLDDKRELSVTIGIYGSARDVLKIAEVITGSPGPFNAKAAEAIGTLLTSVGFEVNQFLGSTGLNYTAQPAKVLSKLENKLNYDWDIELEIKSSGNERYSAGVYCSKYVK